MEGLQVYMEVREFLTDKRETSWGMGHTAPVGTPIKATAGGKILLAQKGFYYTGNVVIIGHGYDLKSMYIHMDKINVKKGDIIKQGDVIGTVGMTGRTLGPHLHGMYIGKILKSTQNF